MADAPVTRDELRNELLALEERLTGRMQAQEDRLIEHMRDMQTEIVRVFMEFQQRN